MSEKLHDEIDRFVDIHLKKMNEDQETEDENKSWSESLQYLSLILDINSIHVISLVCSYFKREHVKHWKMRYTVNRERLHDESKSIFQLARQKIQDSQELENDQLLNEESSSQIAAD